MVSYSWGSRQPIGVHRYARELALALTRRTDTAVTLCATAESRTPRASADLSWAPAGTRIERVRGPRRAVLFGWWTVGRPRVDRATGPVDLVHVTQAAFPVPTRRPVLYTVHDLFPRQHPEWYPIQSRIGHHRALRALERAAAVIAVSSSTADALKTLPWVDPSIVTVVPEGVTRRFAARPPMEEVARACRNLDVEPGDFDVFVGEVTVRKNLTVIVEALARAGSPRPLVIAGPPGDATAAVEALARRRGVSHLLRWPGFVPDDDLHLLLHAARALLHPCPAEGFGLTPLEAMAAGTATVVADAGALPETAGDAARRCAPGDPDAWAAAIDELADPDVVRDLERRGARWVLRYDWDDVAARTVAVYRRALERPEH